MELSSEDYKNYHLPARVIHELVDHTLEYTQAYSWFRILLLAILGGGFITVAALFSLLLGTGIEQFGMQKLVEGFGFSAGFFMVILSRCILFTEANLVAPLSMLHCRARTLMKGIIKFWIIAWVGNFIGAYLFGFIIANTHHYSAAFHDLLSEYIKIKMQYRAIGGVRGWVEIIASGLMANWLVGMAAYLSAMGRNTIDKYVPVLLAVSAFVVAGFQHSPANMAFFSLGINLDADITWAQAFLWNVLPAGIGNILGGSLLVALPFWYVFAKVDTTDK